MKGKIRMSAWGQINLSFEQEPNVRRRSLLEQTGFHPTSMENLYYFSPRG